MNDFDIDEHYDRIISVEMLEHMRNWPDIYSKINRWLKKTTACFSGPAHFSGTTGSELETDNVLFGISRRF